MNPVRNLDPRYAMAEFLWYLDKTGSLEMIMHYAPQYRNFANDNEVHGAYGKRFVNLIPALLNMLGNKTNRRAVIPLYQPQDVAAEKNDIPCTLSWHFLFNDLNELCLISTMRSNDVWLGLPYDIFVNCSIQRFIADLLGVETGWYQHQVGDIHLYEKNVEQAADALLVKPVFPYTSMPLVYAQRSTLAGLASVRLDEASLRRGESVVTNLQDGSFMQDVLACLTGENFINEGLEDAYYRRRGSNGKDNTGKEAGI